MGKRGWTLAIGINVFFFSVLVLEGNLPDGTRTGYLVSVILILSAIVLLIALRAMQINRVRFVDRLIRIQFKICIVMGILNTILLGSIAELMFVAWAVFTGIVYLIFVLKGHRFIGKVEPLELPTQFNSQ